MVNEVPQISQDKYPLTIQKAWIDLIVDKARGHLLRSQPFLKLALLVLGHASLLLFWASRAILVIWVLGNMVALCLIRLRLVESTCFSGLTTPLVAKYFCC